MNATVVGSGSTTLLSGIASFTDLSADSQTLGSSPIGGSTAGLSLTITSASTNLPSPAALGDLNGDGTPDLVGKRLTNGIVVLLGDGAGGYSTTRVNIPVSYNVTQFAVGDFNGDGFQDVAALSYTDAKVVVALG